MQNVTTEQAITNQIASAEMEGFRFSKEEVENVRKCLDGEITQEAFVKEILDRANRRMTSATTCDDEAEKKNKVN